MTATTDRFQQFEARKQDHIRLALETRNQAEGLTGLDDIQLQHDALPECGFADVDLSCTRLGKPALTPFFVSSMTAGHMGAPAINATLLQACQQTGWAMGVGSQRRELTDANAQKEWQLLRQYAPDVDIFGNLGLSQLIETPLSAIQRLCENVNATAMIIHTNPLQECLQPEGTPNFAGGLQALAMLCEQLPCPVIVKETGCGFSRATLLRLKNIGIAAVDVSGLGGTHWGRIEGDRAPDESAQAIAARTFKHWGISTVESLVNGLSVKADYRLWASGGVRSGLDAAKLLALGAEQVGLAKPILAAAIQSVDATVKTMRTLEYELHIALFCTGHVNIAALQENPHAIKR